jgi:hypothetical protein
MLVYVTQQPVTLFSAKTLTSSAADSRNTMNVEGMTKLSLDVNYARGSGETASKLFLQIEHSPDDGANWYSLVIDETSTTSVITAREWEIGSTAKLNILVDIAYHDIRVSARETGVVTNAGTLSVTAVASGL